MRGRKRSAILLPGIMDEQARLPPAKIPSVTANIAIIDNYKIDV